MGSSYKSGRSGVTPEQQQTQIERELNPLDHVDNAFTVVASSLGGFFGSPKNANAVKPEEDKSETTDQDDNTFGQSTMPSEANSTVQSGDWFGYMEKVLFPTNEETEQVSSHYSYII